MKHEGVLENVWWDADEIRIQVNGVDFRVSAQQAIRLVEGSATIAEIRKHPVIGLGGFYE